LASVPSCPTSSTTFRDKPPGFGDQVTIAGIGHQTGSGEGLERGQHLDGGSVHVLLDPVALHRPEMLDLSGRQVLQAAVRGQQ
jgi:hypothetical protein